MRGYSILINSISSPIQVGIYRDGHIAIKITLEGQTSEVLLKTIEKLLEKYDLQKIIYVNGPGSYTAIKLTYLILKTIEMIKKIPFFGVSAFELNGSRPIKAIGKLYFTKEKEKETIISQKFDENIKQEFCLPDDLCVVTLDKDNKPCYMLPAV